MHKSILPITATAATAAVVAAVLCGCEWGGVHSGESWNDAYSWANFSGTYKLVTVVVPPDTTSGSSSTSSTTTTTSTSTTGGGTSGGGTTTESTTTIVETTNTVSWTGTYKGNTEIYNTGKHNVRVGSVTITVAGLEGSFSDADGALKYSGPTANTASFNYSAGSFTLNLVNDTYFMGKEIKFEGQQITKKSKPSGSSSTSTTTNNGDGTTTTTTTTTTTNTDGTSSTSSTSTKTSYIQWLNITQKGNLLTIKDNYGTTYSGRITGASCPTADQGGYITAAHIRFPFEATCTSNSRITLSGSLSGDWSGGSSATSGTLANRAIDATYHTGSSAAQFQAVSGSVSISPQEIAPYAGTTY